MSRQTRADPELSRKFLLVHSAFERARNALAPALLPGADLRAALLEVEKALNDDSLKEVGDFRERIEEPEVYPDPISEAFTILYNAICLDRSCLRWHLGPHKGFITDEGCVLALLVSFDGFRQLNAGKFQPLRQDFPRQADLGGGLIPVVDTKH